MNDEQLAEFYHFMTLIDKRGNVRSDMSPCWRWIKLSFSGTGYGQLQVKGKMWNAHRYSFYIHNGFIELEKGKHICHKCDNKECCNPEHLYLGTAVENSKDTWERGLKQKKEPKPVIRNSEPCIKCVEHHKHCDNNEKEICSYCESQGHECVKKAYEPKPQSFKKGDQAGEKNTHAKLTWNVVREIRQIYAEGIPYGGLKKMAEEYGVSYITIQKVVGNKIWVEQ